MTDSSRPQSTSVNAKCIILAATAVAVLGLIPVAAAPLAAAGVSAVEVSTFRFATALIFAVVWALFQNEQKKIGLSAIKLLIVPGGLLAATSLFYILSLELVPVNVAIVLCFCIAPATATAVNWGGVNDRSIPIIALCGLITGLMVAVNLNGPSEIETSWVGILYALLSGVALGLYASAVGHTRLPPTILICGQFAVALAWHFPLMFLGLSAGFHTVFSDIHLMSAVLVLGAFMTCGPYIVFAKLRSENRLGASSLATLFALEPALAIIGAWLFLGQEMSLSNLIGTATVVIIATLYSTKH